MLAAKCCYATTNIYPVRNKKGDIGDILHTDLIHKNESFENTKF